MHSVPRTERRLVLVPRDEARVPACSKLEVLLPGALGCTGLQRFIGETYARIHGARIEHFARHLIGIRGRDAQWAAGVGYTVANEQALFLEQYLDRPIESEITRRCAQTVSRSRIVEVGTHSELLAGGGIYAELERIQREGADASDYETVEAPV